MPHSTHEGGAYTNWSTMGMAQMWDLLAHYDTNPQWTHVSGWQKAYELASTHLRRMKEYRERISVIWPPERNESAQAYLARMDEMIDSIQATYDAASTNYSTVSAATAAIETTRTKLQPAYEEWLANEEKLAVYRQPTGTPVPAPGPPPVSPGRQEELTRQARSLMTELSGALASASYRIVTPPGYTAPKLKKDDGLDVPLRIRNVPLVSPVIPPILPTRPAPSSSETSPALRAPTNGSRNPRNGQMPSFSVLPGTLARPEPSTRSPSASKPWIIDPSRSLLPPGGGKRPSDMGATAPAATGEARPNKFSPGYTARPMTPGGVIGAPPGAGLAQPGGRGPIQAINPVGGVFGSPTSGAPGGGVRSSAQAVTFISGQRAGGVPDPGVLGGQRSGITATDHRFASGSPRKQPTGGFDIISRQTAHSSSDAAGGSGQAAFGSFRTPDGHLVSITGAEQSQRRYEEHQTLRPLDSDSPWKINNGVAPVVEAPLPPGRHDPGPTIGLA